MVPDEFVMVDPPPNSQEKRRVDDKEGFIGMPEVPETKAAKKLADAINSPVPDDGAAAQRHQDALLKQQLEVEQRMWMQKEALAAEQLQAQANEEEAQRQKIDQQSANSTPDSSGGVAALRTALRSSKAV